MLVFQEIIQNIARDDQVQEICAFARGLFMIFINKFNPNHYIMKMNKGSASCKSDHHKEHNNENQLTASPPNSFHLKHDLNSASIEHGRQKIDAETMTDQIICRCDCDQIAKLKEKAHKSFMQVIQIENLYKEEIEQLQEQYEERQKTQLKKFQCKQALLTEKCKQLEQELEKNRQYLQKCREEQVERNKKTNNHVLEFSIESPFIIDDVDDVQAQIESSYQANPDDSIDTIRHLEHFIPSQNLHEQHQLLDKNFQDFIKQFKEVLSKSQKNSEVTRVFDRVEKSVSEVMDLLKVLIDNAVSSQDKYNQLIHVNTQLQGRYNKTINAFEASQKQIKFMSEHIRRISQDKINIDRKYHEIDKNNKHLQETVRFLRKNLLDKGIDQKNDRQIIPEIKFGEEDGEINIEMKSVGPKRNERPPIAKLNNHEPRQLNNFKKKLLFMPKKQ